MFAALRSPWTERTKRYAMLLMLGWSSVVFLSLAWNVLAIRDKNIDIARTEARTFYDLNLAFRHWTASHGGVYVPVTDTVRPNPYLTIKERDITTTTGRKLTLMNPAWITREVFERLTLESSQPVISHLTSLKYLNPTNKPDAWEEHALRSFERGATQATTDVVLNGEPYTRVMLPYVIEEPCLTCHSQQGYKVGDIRGGISISVPMRPHLEAAKKEQRAVLVSHLVLWFIGSGGILLFGRSIRGHQLQVEESEERYRLLFNSNPQPMWVYDLDTLRFLDANEAAVRHYGYSREEFLRMTVRGVLPDGDPRAETGCTTAGGARLHRKKDGSLIHVETTSHPVNLGRRRAQIVLATDVTGRMHLEDQLRQAQKMEAVGLLAGGVAHDFNNVLTAIIGYGNLIQIKLPQNDPLRAYAENIKVTAQRAAQLTQSLLTFSRKQVIRLMPVDLNSVVRRIERLLKRLIREDIELRSSLTDRDTTILADSVQVEQVIMNLVTNARDAMPDGGVLTISTEIADLGSEDISRRGYGKTGTYVLLTVADTGGGMDEQTRRRVFEPFFTTKEMGKGTGLGLATVYGIVKQHQGLAEVDSAPGRGTSVRIYLPFVHASSLGKDGAESPPPRGGNRETVLLAEDDEAIRTLTSSVLAEFGYRVLEARDGEEALRLFRERGEDVKLLLLDVIMPKKNGRTVYEEIRTAKPDVKALFISGYSADMISREGVLESGLHFIAKPLSPTELLHKVREVLDS